ncbi:MAG: hypothetical protein ACO1OT_00325 [Heyndrickxia sp.]
MVILENFISYVYAVVSSDKENKDEPNRKAIFGAIFLLSLFEIITMLPIALVINYNLNVLDISAFISQNLSTRYFFIFLVLASIFAINYGLLGNGIYIRKLATEYEYKRELYIKYRWLLPVIFFTIWGVLLLLARVVKTTNLF